LDAEFELVFLSDDVILAICWLGQFWRSTMYKNREERKLMRGILVSLLLYAVLTFAHVGFANADTLQEAARRGDLQAVTRFLNQGVNPDARDTEGVTALMHAAEQGHAAVVGILLKKNANPNLRESSYGMTALMVSAAEGHTEVVRLLLDSNADVNLKDNNLGATALLGAAEYGHTEIIKLLLQKGADVNASDSRGFRALSTAATKGYIETVQTLVQSGADINAQDSKYGASPLMGGAANDHYTVVEYLLKHGADTTLKAKNGSTALDFAKTRGHAKVAELIETFKKEN
jgi:ankyrin repeat protein